MRRLIVMAALSGLVVSSLHAQPAAPTRPNIVLIITDDVGYGDFGSYGAPDIKTPHIDSLARDGTKLTDCGQHNCCGAPPGIMAAVP